MFFSPQKNDCLRDVKNFLSKLQNENRRKSEVVKEFGEWWHSNQSNLKVSEEIVLFFLFGTGGNGLLSVLDTTKSTQSVLTALAALRLLRNLISFEFNEHAQLFLETLSKACNFIHLDRWLEYDFWNAKMDACYILEAVQRQSGNGCFASLDTTVADDDNRSQSEYRQWFAIKQATNASRLLAFVDDKAFSNTEIESDVKMSRSGVVAAMSKAKKKEYYKKLSDEAANDLVNLFIDSSIEKLFVSSLQLKEGEKETTESSSVTQQTKLSSDFTNFSADSFSSPFIMERTCSLSYQGGLPIPSFVSKRKTKKSREDKTIPYGPNLTLKQTNQIRSCFGPHSLDSSTFTKHTGASRFRAQSEKWLPLSPAAFLPSSELSTDSLSPLSSTFKLKRSSFSSSLSIRSFCEDDVDLDTPILKAPTRRRRNTADYLGPVQHLKPSARTDWILVNVSNSFRDINPVCAYRIESVAPTSDKEVVGEDVYHIRGHCDIPFPIDLVASLFLNPVLVARTILQNSDNSLTTEDIQLLKSIVNRGHWVSKVLCLTVLEEIDDSTVLIEILLEPHPCLGITARMCYLRTIRSFVDTQTGNVTYLFGGQTVPHPDAKPDSVSASFDRTVELQLCGFQISEVITGCSAVDCYLKISESTIGFASNELLGMSLHGWITLSNIFRLAVLAQPYRNKLKDIVKNIEANSRGLSPGMPLDN